MKKFFKFKIEDIYLLKDTNIAEILKLKRMGLKSYTNLINAIENSKKHSLDKILYGLGILAKLVKKQQRF